MASLDIPLWSRRFLRLLGSTVPVKLEWVATLKDKISDLVQLYSPTRSAYALPRAAKLGHSPSLSLSRPSSWSNVLQGTPQ